MVTSFANRLARDLVEGRSSKAVRSFPPGLVRIARKKLAMLHAAKEVRDLRSPPGNRLERLRGDRSGHYSIRINEQWRIVFQFTGANAESVSLEDYHR